MKKRVVIFDLDGTLLNTLDDLADSTNYALTAFNYPTRTIDEVRQFVGDGVLKLVERAIPNGQNNFDFERCLEVFKQNYSQNMYNKTRPYDGIIDLLKNIKQKGYKIAVVSNKFDAAVKELCEKYFSGLIDIAIGENEKCGIKKKPAPDTVYLASELLSAKIGECVYVGDSDVDIQTAQNAGIPCISVLWGFRDEEFLKNSGADKFVSYPKEILSYIEN